MKKTGFLVLIFLLAYSVSPAGSGHRRHWGWELDDTIISVLNLSPVQQGKLDQLRVKYSMETAGLQNQKIERRAALRLLWRQVEPDVGKLKATQKEIHDIIRQLIDKTTDLRLAVRGVLTSEQLGKALQLAFEKNEHTAKD